MHESLSFVGGVALGLLGSVHCVAMCGGIAGALSVAASVRRRTLGELTLLQVCYSLGRAATYTVGGLVAGAAGLMLAGATGHAGMVVLRTAAGGLLVLMGLHLAGWSSALARFEQAAGSLWRSLTQRVRPARPGTSYGGALLVGVAWGFLPCGLVYSTLALAGATGDPVRGALVMGGFALGTSPAVVAAGVIASRVPASIRSVGSRRVAAVLVILFGVWTMAAGGLVPRGGSDAQPCPMHPGAPE